MVLSTFAFADLTDREVVLLGVFQTLLSIGIGWIVTHAYAENSLASAISEVDELYKKNLETYALKASEKVENLSQQISSLASYLEEELEESSYPSAQEELAAKEERIYSAIHLLRTLRSVNDTSLSDWKGVIGKELELRREAAEEREERLDELVQRVEALEPRVREDAAPKSSVLLLELGNLKDEVRRLARQTGLPLSAARKHPKTLVIQTLVPCPSCDQELKVNFKDKPGSIKALDCPGCESQLIFERTAEAEGRLRVRRYLTESYRCPECAAENAVELDEWPSATTENDCPACATHVRVSRASGELRVAVINSPITSEMLEQVRLALPVQPWVKGVHRIVGEQLRIPHKRVQKAIQHLIVTGVFKDQYNGIICTPEEKLRMVRLAGKDI